MQKQNCAPDVEQSASFEAIEVSNLLGNNTKRKRRMATQ